MGPWGQWGGEGGYFQVTLLHSPFYRKSPAEIPFGNYGCQILLFLYSPMSHICSTGFLVPSCFEPPCFCFLEWLPHLPWFGSLSFIFSKQLQVGLSASHIVSHASRFHSLKQWSGFFCLCKLVEGKGCAPCPSKFSIWRFQIHLWMWDSREKYQSGWFGLINVTQSICYNFYCLYLKFKPSFAFASIILVAATQSSTSRALLQFAKIKTGIVLN